MDPSAWQECGKKGPYYLCGKDKKRDAEGSHSLAKRRDHFLLRRLCFVGKMVLEHNLKFIKQDVSNFAS